MKITIELTEAQVMGLKTYISETSGCAPTDVKKPDIAKELQSIVECTLQSGAVADYIQEFS